MDAAAPEPVDVLIDRAAAAVAREARRMLGGAYGRRVIVLAGKGNNGNDGRVAAVRLRAMGMKVTVLDAANAPEQLLAADLVIDAAYGTGFRGSYVAPRPSAGSLVLAVDIPSGVSGLTGTVSGTPLRADRTVTFAALKPGLLLGDGRELSGDVELVDIGLDVSHATINLVQAVDVAGWCSPRRRDAHKWNAATWVVAGSPTMLGAGRLAARSALRGGASYVRLSAPGVVDDPGRPVETVGWPLPEHGWADAVVAEQERFASIAVGPGLGRGPVSDAEVRRLVAASHLPLVVDGDGIRALGAEAAAVIAERDADAASVVLTPHEGEFRALGGELGGSVENDDRVHALRKVAAAVRAVVLLKGPTTLVADPEGTVLVVTTGDERLATAGTGDVLTGLLAALLARGCEPLRAAAAAAWLHGRAGALAWRHGLVAGDLPDRLPSVFAELWPDA